jgi:hypothetical protein
MVSIFGKPGAEGWTHDESVEEASRLSIILVILLGLFSFFVDVVHGLLVGRIVFVEVD